MTEQLIKAILAEELYGSSICESAEQFSDINYLYEVLMLEKLLFGEPVTVPELRKLLHNKIINFEFIKLDGEVRPARGTTMMKYIPTADHPKGIRPSSKKVATFFDLKKDAWRSVSQKSREIVLKKDEKTGKPVVVVKPKGVPAPEEKPVEEPVEVEPEVPEVEPEVTAPEVEIPEIEPEVTEKPEISKEPEEEPEEELEKIKAQIDKANAQAKEAERKAEKAKTAWQKLKQLVGLGGAPKPTVAPTIAPPVRSTILIPSEVKDDSKKPPIELPDEVLPSDWAETNPFRLGASLRPFESWNPPKTKIVRESLDE